MTGHLADASMVTQSAAGCVLRGDPRAAREREGEPRDCNPGALSASDARSGVASESGARSSRVGAVRPEGSRGRTRVNLRGPLGRIAPLGMTCTAIPRDTRTRDTRALYLLARDVRHVERHAGVTSTYASLLFTDPLA